MTTSASSSASAAAPGSFFGGLSFLRNAVPEGASLSHQDSRRDSHHSNHHPRQATTMSVRECTIQDARVVVANPEEFRLLQTVLRQNDCITDLTLKMNLHKLLRERRIAMEMKRRGQQQQKRTTFKGYQSNNRSPQSVTDVMNIQALTLQPVPDLDGAEEKEASYS